MAFESNIFIDVLSALTSRSLVFSSSYLNFEDFLCYLILSLSEVLYQLRGGGITFPPLLFDIQRCGMILILLTFSSLMMHDCEPVNMTGALRSNTSVFPSSAVSPLQSVASLADLLTSSHARYSTESSLLL